VTAPRLELSGVGKRFRRGGATSLQQRFLGRGTRGQWVTALHDVDLAVGPGEIVGVLGRNGGGKSTLLRVAGGLTRASSGSVQRHAAVSGLLTLNGSASGDLSGADNAVTGAVLAGLSPRAARGRLPEIAAFAELDDAVLREPMRTYSDGMKLRLAFAAAAMTDPDLLLIDEVLAVGDIAFQEKCLTHIERLRDGGTALLVASHVTSHMRRLATRAVWLRGGTVVADGPPSEVIDEYEASLDERAGAPQDLAGGGFRKGTGEVRIAGITSTGSQGAGPGATRLGGGLTVTVAYHREASVTHANFSVSLRRVGGDVKVVDLTTEASGAAVPLADEGSISVAIDRLDLEPGTYWLDAGIYSKDWEVPYDYHWDAWRVHVLGTGTSGILQPPHAWRVDG